MRRCIWICAASKTGGAIGGLTGVPTMGDFTPFNRDFGFTELMRVRLPF